MSSYSKSAHLPLSQPAPVRLESERPRAARKPFPVYLTSFVGRERELTNIDRLLTGPVRLLTLTGMGGVGKTRLAVAAASALTARFEDGAAFVPLADVEDPELVVPAMARSLGFQARNTGDSETLLRYWLAEREMLLVLDNLERLSLADPITELLQAAPRITIIATSRALLRISGEQVFPVQPLNMPASTGPLSASCALDHAPVQLFVDRAKAVLPEFELNGQNASAVVAICRRLDGLPLAIELAAARSNVLSPESLLARMDRVLPLLKSGSRDQPERLQTLSRAIAWSYDLLTPTEQLLLRWVAVFRGGLTLAALAKLEKSAPFAGYGPAIELLASLVDKSLVHPLPAQSQAGPDRFTMLETVREFALGELSSSGDWELAHEALLTHFLDDTVGTTMLWVTPLRGEDDGSFFARWEQDLPSVRVALQWALDTGRVDAALRLASSLFLVWWAPGPLHEGRLWLERGLESGQSLDPLTRGLAHLVLSALIQRQHQADLAVHHAKRAIVLFEGIGHIECTGVSHYLLAIAQYSQGNLHAAIRSYRRSRRLLSSCNTAIAAEAMIGEAQVARELGELERAASLYEETLAFQIENHIFWGAALSRYGYGAVLQESGDIAAASKYYLQSLQYWHVIGDLQSLAICLEAIASARCREGNAATAAQLLAAAHATRANANCPVPPQSVQSYGGLLAMVRATLGAKPFDIAWLAGLKLTPGEAVQLAEASPRDSVPAAPSDVQAKPTFELTSRERDVLRLIADGHTDREIAERLFISRRTASEHVGNILRKIGARSRADAAAFAVRSGLDRSNLQST